jgi:hypothetical protein
MAYLKVKNPNFGPFLRASEVLEGPLQSELNRVICDRNLSLKNAKNAK